MKNIKKINFYNSLMLLIATLGITNPAIAQQDSQFTNYMYNTANVNPAYVGSREVLSIFGLYRTQWVGLEGAPETGTFSISSPINEKVGLGLSVINDRIGPSDETNISVDFSYNINLNENYKLFFGLKGSANLLNVDYTKLNIYNPTDPRFQNNIDNQFSPNVGAGLYLHSDKGYVGLSVPYMIETKHYNDSDLSVASEKMHYHLIGGYVFEFSDNIKFKPAFLTKLVQGAPLQVDLSANFLFNEKFTLGAAYRWDAAVSALAAFQISEKLLIGYAYDLDTTKLGNYNSGSHELFLRFELFKNYERIVTPRFF